MTASAAHDAPAERRRHFVALGDPRRSPRITARDLDALRFIGRGHEVAQYQLHEAVFTGRAEGIVSRWVHRMADRELIAVERWAKVGINRLRLTRAGADALVVHGIALADIFTPRAATALKDVQHTLWINDLRVVVSRLALPPDVIAPAWLLQRQLGGSAIVVPDLLAIRTTNPGRYVFAFEIDLGAERLQSVFLPKLGKLQAEVRGWAEDGVAGAIVVLTRGERRVAALRAKTAGGDVPIVIEELPRIVGRPAIRLLAEQLAGAVHLR